jgi:hypothetical protein
MWRGRSETSCNPRLFRTSHHRCEESAGGFWTGMFWRDDVSCCGATRTILAITTNSKLNYKNRGCAGGMRSANAQIEPKTRVWFGNDQRILEFTSTLAAQKRGRFAEHEHLTPDNARRSSACWDGQLVEYFELPKSVYVGGRLRRPEAVAVGRQPM